MKGWIRLVRLWHNFGLMQRIDKILGFQIRVSEYLPAVRLAGLGDGFIEAARKHGLQPEDYWVYVHNLSISPGKVEFLKNTRLSERVHSVVMRFDVNQKQRESGRILFVNQLFRGLVEPDHQFADYHWIQYTIMGHELEALGTFSNQLITFIHKSLPRRHRKIKVTVRARPTELLPEKLRKNIVTGLDLRYEKYTPFQLLNARNHLPTSEKSLLTAQRIDGDPSEEFKAEPHLQIEALVMNKYVFQEKVTRSAIGDHAQFIEAASRLTAEDLAEALGTVALPISSRAKSATEREDARLIESAHASATAGDKIEAIKILKGISSWGWDVVKELSASLTVEALKQLVQ